MSDPLHESPGGPLPPDPQRLRSRDEPFGHVGPAPRQEPARRGRMLPVVLYVATCFTTYEAGGLVFAAGIMTILTCHEFGHYFQARRYRVPASLPYFIPMPISPFGTMGAVILMRGHMGNRKSLFDIGITGPLAGLVPALVCCVVGLHWSNVADVTKLPPTTEFGEPLLFKLLIGATFGSLAENETVVLHPLALAGWVGIFITALNLFPIGQLDGGHVLYAILRKKAYFVASALLFGAIALVLLTSSYDWLFILLLLLWVGPKHPPTANDDMPLGTGRIILGWLTLAFLFVGFTPRPFLSR
jgi:membrane-associated protease RseP (regulator of RpoE activity)